MLILNIGIYFKNYLYVKLVILNIFDKLLECHIDFYLQFIQ